MHELTEQRKKLEAELQEFSKMKEEFEKKVEEERKREEERKKGGARLTVR